MQLAFEFYRIIGKDLAEGRADRGDLDPVFVQQGLDLLLDLRRRILTNVFAIDAAQADVLHAQLAHSPELRFQIRVDFIGKSGDHKFLHSIGLLS